MPHSPDAEIVTLVRQVEPVPGSAGEGRGQALVFGVVFEDGRWCVDDIERRDDPDPA